MFDINDILAELAAGKSIEQIAQNAADALNAAKAQFDKQEAERKAKEEAARKAREEEENKKRLLALQKKRKMTSATAIMDSLFDYMDEFHPGFFSPKELEDFHRTFDPEALVDAIDETVKMIKALPSVEKAIAKAGDSRNVNVKLNE